MKYCKKCLTTNLRPNSSINNNGLCIACNYSINTSKKSFLSHLDTLKSMIQKNKARRKNHPKYDCIVGVSGGKDSTRQAHWVRDRLGLNPLLVCCGYPPLQMTDTGAHNMSNLISMGFDIEVFTPAPQSSAKLSLFSFLKFGNVCKSAEMALFSAVPRIAISKKIPLIFWGENPALQVGDANTEGVNYFDGNNLRNLNTLIDGGVEWIFDNISTYKAQAYVYPSVESFDKAKVDIKPFFDWLGVSDSGFELFVKERIVRYRNKISTNENTKINIKDLFSLDFFHGNDFSINKKFVSYHKGI